MLTIRPYPRSIICFPKTWHDRSVPVRFVSMIPFHSSSCSSRVGVRFVRPAELTRMSTLPNALIDACSSSSNVDLSETSEVTRSVRLPRRSISPATASTCAARCRDYIGSGLREPYGDGAPDSRRAADDYGNLPIQFKWLISHMCDQFAQFENGSR